MAILTTTQGLVHQLQTSPPRAYLYDFDIDGHELKTAHKKWLDASIVNSAYLGGSNAFWQVYIQGMASRTGSDSHNCVLSQQRARAAESYLRQKFAGYSRNVRFFSHWVGEHLAADAGRKDNTEYPLDRAVQICAQLSTPESPGPKPPPPIKRPSPPKSGSKEFKLRIITAKSASAGIPSPIPILGGGLGTSDALIEILDIEAKLVATYSFSGTGKMMGLGSPKIPVSADVTAKGPWNDFKAPRSMTVRDFGGEARLDSCGLNYIIGSYSKTSLEFGGISPKMKWYTPVLLLRFKIDSLKTGRTMGTPGLGCSAYLGKTHLIKQLVRPYRGD